MPKQKQRKPKGGGGGAPLWQKCAGCVGAVAVLCSGFRALTSPTSATPAEGWLGSSALLAEMGTIFEEEYLFLGGDELATSCFDDSPAVAAWMKARGLNASSTQQYFWAHYPVPGISPLMEDPGIGTSLQRSPARPRSRAAAARPPRRRRRGQTGRRPPRRPTRRAWRRASRRTRAAAGRAPCTSSPTSRRRRPRTSSSS